MKHLEWNDGMSVGVEVIDNDHKKLIKLINNLSEAIQNDKAADLLESISDELVEYVKVHFSREEDLMRRCGYDDFDDHARQHQGFAEKIPQLKQQLLSSEGLKVALEVDLFLYKWLIHHILIDDMSYAQAVYDKGMADGGRTKKSYTNRVIDAFRNRLSLGRRILFLTLVPILGLVSLVMVIIYRDYQVYRSFEKLHYHKDIAISINQVSHQLQLERGLTSGYIGSAFVDFHDKLFDQRKQTRPHINLLKRRVSKSPPAILSGDIRFHLEQFYQLNSSIDQLHQQVDQQQVTFLSARVAYTRQIHHLLEVVGHIAHRQEYQQISNQFMTLHSLLKLKEALGQERAFGAYGISKGDFKPLEVQFLKELSSQQKWWLNLIEKSGTAEFIAKLNFLYSGKADDNIQAEEVALFSAIEASRLHELDSVHWFRVLSININQLKEMADHLVEQIQLNADETLLAIKIRASLTAAVLLIILSLTVLFSLILNRSVIYPIRKLTKALSSLARGDMSYRFTDHFGSDELSEMVDAYEASRRGLLQASVASAIQFQLKDIDLLQQKRETDIYYEQASTDALTGAVNRRKFDEVADKEIKRVHRYSTWLSLMMLDIDHFKRVNDTYGHDAGDEVLQQFYNSCQQAARETDVIVRMGGEEFAILMPDTDLQQALIGAERMRQLIQDLEITFNEFSIQITVSIGLSEVHKTNEKSIKELLKQADIALYQAKESGRNRVVIYEQS